jgi:hypothetical protein
MSSRRRVVLVLGLVVAFGAFVNATRPEPEQTEVSGPGKMPLEYRPVAFFPSGLKLHGTVKRLSPPIVEMGKRTRIQVEYTVGDLQIEEGMAIEIWKHFVSDVEDFQVDDERAPGYFGADTTASDVQFTTRMFPNSQRYNTPTAFPYRKCVRATVTAGKLATGDKVLLDLGGAKGVRMQSYAENLFNFRVAIVQDADGKLLGYGGDVLLKVTGGLAANLRVAAPAVVALGESFSVAAVPQDKWGSLARDHRGLELRITDGEGAGSKFTYDEELTHYVARNVVASSEGVVRFTVMNANGSLSGISNPVWVEREPLRRVYYGDLHQHTYLGDGRGVFKELYLNARRTGLLDFGAITPHHMSLGLTGPILQLEGQEFPKDNWPDLEKANRVMKGWKGFVPILAYEYSVGTKLGGHHNIYYDGDEGPTTMQLEPNDPKAPIEKMLQILKRGRKRTLVIPHIGGGPPNWNHPTDQRMERLFEVASVHGVFEESWSKHLEAGVRLAASASGDTHTTGFGYANPGLSYTMTNPLTGVYAHRKSRAEIWDALYEKRTFAVTGNIRMLVDFTVNGEPMGGELPLGLNKTAHLSAKVSGTAPLARIDIVKNSKVIHTVHPSRNSGKLVRVKWGDNLYGRRAHVSLATGELTAAQGVLQLRRALHVDNSFEHIEADGGRVTWTTSTTSNDRDAVMVETSGASGALQFRLDDPGGAGALEVDVPLDRLYRDGHFEWSTPIGKTKERFNESYMKMMGVQPAFHLECELIDSKGPLDLELQYEDRVPLSSGDYYYLRAEQLDTNLAWSSPVWVN